MIAYLIRRLFGFVVTIVLISAAVFLVLSVIPGDPAQIIVGIEADPATYQAVRTSLGLDQSALHRYITWLRSAVCGDFGTSISLYQGRSIATLIGSRLRITLPLTALALALTLLLSLPLGVYTATHHNRVHDYVGRLVMQIGMILPEFWVGILLIFLFAVTLHWVPVLGGGGMALILPTIALALPRAAVFGRMTRAALLETLTMEYITAVRAKGVSEGRVIYKHALRNALIPLATLAGLLIAQLIAGSIIVENVFGLRGIGQLAYDAIGARDLPLVQAITVLIAALIVLINLAVDVFYGLLDPRIRYQ